MTQIIIGCIIANILTITIVGIALYVAYRKNEARLKEVGDELKEKIESVKETVTKVTAVIDDIKNVLDKLPFGK